MIDDVIRKKERYEEKTSENEMKEKLIVCQHIIVV